MFAAPVLPIEAGAGPIRCVARLPRRQARRRRLAGRVLDDPGRSPDYPEAAWGRRVYTVAALYAGDADEGERLLQPLLELGEPIVGLHRPDGLPRRPAAVRHGDPVRPAPLLLEEPLPRRPRRRGDRPDPRRQRARRRRRTRCPRSGTSAARRRRSTPTATAFGDRSMPWMVSIDSIWDTADQDDANIAWTRAFWERLEPYSDRGRIYLNFAGHGEDNDDADRVGRSGRTTSGWRRSSAATTRPTRSASTRTSGRRPERSASGGP